jgi:hypothetical protein
VFSRDARLRASSFQETKIPVHGHADSKLWSDLFTGRAAHLENGCLALDKVFSDLPVAVLIPLQVPSPSK